MTYNNIVFHVDNFLGEYLYSFKINMQTQQLSVEYKNNQGGYTSNGISLGSRQIKYITKISDRAEEYRSKLNLIKQTISFHVNSWSLQITNDDGKSMLELKNFHDGDIYFTPDFIKELVDFVMGLATFDNKNITYF